VTIPRVVHGTVAVPSAAERGRATVIVGLGLAPLAGAYGNGLGYRVGQRQLDVASPSSRAYLARIDTAQRAAIARLRRAIPQA
jgi:hypothetical protein